MTNLRLLVAAARCWGGTPTGGGKQSQRCHFVLLFFYRFFYKNVIMFFLKKNVFYFNFRPNLSGSPRPQQVVRKLFPDRFSEDGKELKPSTVVVVPGLPENMSTRGGTARVMGALLGRLHHDRKDLTNDKTPILIADEAVQSITDSSKKNIAIKLVEEGLGPDEDDATALTMVSLIAEFPCRLCFSTFWLNCSMEGGFHVLLF